MPVFDTSLKMVCSLYFVVFAHEWLCMYEYNTSSEFTRELMNSGIASSRIWGKGGHPALHIKNFTANFKDFFANRLGKPPLHDPCLVKICGPGNQGNSKMQTKTCS
jgi:hypothetical protein